MRASLQSTAVRDRGGLGRMGRGWTFRLPRDIADRIQPDLAEAALIGRDQLRRPTEVDWDGERLTLRRDVHDPSAIQLPLSIPDFGRLLARSCALPEGGEYQVLLELARGEVDRVRNEFAECERKGFRPSHALQQLHQQTSLRLSSAVFSSDPQESLDAVRAALWCGESLIEEFGRQSASHRKGRPDKPIRLSCVFDDRFFDVENPASLRKLFDAVTIPVDWRSLELDSGERQWEALEQRVDWCLDRGLAVTVGPILDLNALPAWLTGLDEDDAAQMLMIDLVETAVGRLQDRVTSWEVVAGANSSSLFHGDDRALVLLVMKSLEAVRLQDPQARLTLTVDRPWGDYLGETHRRTGPIEFLDRLIRMDVPIATLNVEIAVGVDGGSRRRPVVDFRRLLDRYSDLGPALSVRLYHPAETGEDPGYLGQSGEDRQADWLESHLLAAVSSPSVERVEWGRLHDFPEQPWPGCGLFSESREPRRALRRLRAVRKACF
jgi:hypothetical protein